MFITQLHFFFILFYKRVGIERDIQLFFRLFQTLFFFVLLLTADPVWDASSFYLIELCITSNISLNSIWPFVWFQLFFKQSVVFSDRLLLAFRFFFLLEYRLICHLVHLMTLCDSVCSPTSALNVVSLDLNILSVITKTIFVRLFEDIFFAKRFVPIFASSSGFLPYHFLSLSLSFSVAFSEIFIFLSTPFSIFSTHLFSLSFFFSLFQSLSHH